MEACGRWPSFPSFPFPFRNRGCPVLAFSARAGGDACTIWFVVPSGLRRIYGAHHLYFITCSCNRRLPFLCSARSRGRFLSIMEQIR